VKVLIAIDSSSFSTDVLRAVAKRRWDPDTKLRVLTVVEPSTEWDTTQQLLRQCEVILEERVKKLRAAMPGSSVAGELIEGVAADAINETAEKWGADLIVIGSHGDTGVRRSRIGSVAAEVVNEAPCSVEVVKVRTAQKHRQNKNHSVREERVVASF
jgi:nucleotide-binding universal stress UspA family protein